MPLALAYAKRLTNSLTYFPCITTRTLAATGLHEDHMDLSFYDDDRFLEIEHSLLELTLLRQADIRNPQARHKFVTNEKRQVP